MRRIWIAIVGLGALLGGAANATAQKATEFYIPVGKSPGVSGISTALGSCQSVDTGKRTVTVRGRFTTWTGAITGQTKIWLDRSKVGLPNRTGTLADLKPGLRIEVKYEGKKRTSGAACEWIKIQLVHD